MTVHILQIICIAFSVLFACTSAQELIWECNDFPSDGPFDGNCNWERGNFHWGEENIDVGQDDQGDYVSIFYPEGSYAGVDEKGGTQFYSSPFESHDRILLEYQLYFSDNFDFVLGGKLPGLYGGDGQCSGGESSNCFSTRFMWRAEGALEIYGYLPHEEGDWFCDDEYVHCDFTWGHSFGRGTVYLEIGRWYTVAQEITLNDPGQANAEMKMLVDGNEVYSISGLTMRQDTTISIDTIYFSTFFGGSSTPDFASTADCHTYYRDFKVYKY